MTSAAMGATPTDAADIAPPLRIVNARILALAGSPNARRGSALRDLAPLERGEVVVRDGVIEAVGETAALPAHPEAREIDAGGRVLMPAFIDAHTHALWAGERLDEFEQKLAGASYLDILKAGGGIMSTVRAVRAASQQQLTDSLLARLRAMLREGTTSVEIKSGYGLSTEAELKMLHAIAAAARDWPGNITLTACVGHAIDPEFPGGRDAFIEHTINETLPAVHDEFPGVAIDAYCEDGAWSLGDCARLFERAIDLGHPVRVHADQFNSLGMTRWAIERGARSVDHLEAATPADLRVLAASHTFGVVLPCSGFQTDDRYADARAFVDQGGAVVLATNCNPGTAPTHSMPFAIALAARKNRLTPAEAIAACTANAAALLGLEDRGRIEVGLRADLVLLRHKDERMLAYELGGNPVDMTICGGRIAWEA